MGWKEVQEKIVQDDQNKWDRQVSGQELRVSESGALKVLNGQKGDAGVFALGYGNVADVPEIGDTSKVLPAIDGRDESHRG